MTWSETVLELVLIVLVALFLGALVGAGAKALGLG